MLAKTTAAGSTSLLPEVLALTSSLALDRSLLREDLVGSLAHLTMLERTRLIARAEATELRRGIFGIWEDSERGVLVLPEEEDVHMAVESELGRRIGAAAGVLHTARSRNDQVALDLRLHVRERCVETLTGIARLMLVLVERAEAERDTLLPSYTHRQRAQPISAAYWLLGLAASLERDLQAWNFVYDQADVLPLGAGAIAGSSLPIDRELTRSLLRFSRVTVNGLDTVGDRDFALDYAYAASRLSLHASRFATDVIDFSSREFGFLVLDGEIACGSSMMPQKRNPDLFELVRGRAASSVGDLVSLLVLTKGLPGGYNRDLQEGGAAVLAIGTRIREILASLTLGLPRIRFDRERCLEALREDATQATDLAEALVREGMAFRTAYRKVGALVRFCQDKGLALEQVTPTQARAIDPAFTDAVIATAKVENSVAKKVSAGSTGPKAVQDQLDQLRLSATEALQEVETKPRLAQLMSSLKEASR